MTDSHLVYIKIRATLMSVVVTDSSIERSPALQFFPSRTLWRQIYTTPVLTLGTPVEVTLFSYIAASATPEKIKQALQHSFINVSGITELLGAEWCQKFAGSGRVSLLELFNQHTPCLSHQMHLRVRMAENGKYAPKMSVLIEPMSLTLDGVNVLLEGGVPQFMATLKHECDTRCTLLTDYILSTHTAFSALPLTFAQTKRIGSYMWKLSSGSLMPTVGYLMQNKAAVPVTEEYFHNSLLIVLEEEGMSEDDYLQLAPNSLRAASIMMRTLCTWVHGVPYISDMAYLAQKDNAASAAVTHDRVLNRLKIHRGTAESEEPTRVDLEEMQLPELTNSADCEDTGGHICRLSVALVSLEVVQSRIVALLQATRRLYIFFLVLMAVTSADIGGSVAALKSSSESLGAHMLAVAYPVRKVIDMITRVSKTDLFSKMSVRLEEAYAQSEKLPLLLGEGTGVLLPVPTEFPEKPVLLLPVAAKPRPESEAQATRLLEFAFTASANSSKSTPLALMEMPNPTEELPFKSLNKRVWFVSRNSGSARLSSAASSDPLYTMNSMWMTELLLNLFPEAFRGLRHTYTWRHGECHFYRVMQAAFTTELYQMGYGVCGFACVRRERSGGEWTVGYAMGDLDEKDGVQVGLWPEPPLREEHERAIHFLMRDSPPQPRMWPPRADVWDVPDEARWNNVTTTFLTRQQVQDHAVFLAALQHTAVRTGLWMLLALFSTNSSQTVLGSLLACPIANCKCQARKALEAVLEADEVLRVAYMELCSSDVPAEIVTWIEAALKSRRPAEHNLPITPTFFSTRSQISSKSRIMPLLKAAGAAINLSFNDNTVHVLFVPTNLHWCAQHATMDVGTYRLSFNYLMIV